MESLSPGKGIETASSDVLVRDTVESPTQTFFGVYGKESSGVAPNHY